MASTFTPAIGLEMPARDDYKNTWDVPNNANFAIIDTKLGGTGSIGTAANNAAIVLTKAQAQNAALVLTGNLSAPIVVSIPQGMSGPYSFLNGTTGGQPITLQTTAGAGALTILPGVRTLVFCDGTNVFLADQSGTPAGAVIGWFGSSIPSGFILAYGQVLAIAAQPGIYGAYGTAFNTGNEGTGNFRMPDLRGRVLAGLDNMGGPAAGNLTNIPSVVGQAGGEQTHNLGVFELPSHNHPLTDPGHSHPITDPQHGHTYTSTFSDNTNEGGGSGGPKNSGSSQILTAQASTGISVNNSPTGITLANTGGGTPHNNIQPTIFCNWIVKT